MLFFEWMRIDMKMKTGSIESRIDYSVILPTLFLLIIGVLAVFVAVS